MVSMALGHNKVSCPSSRILLDIPCKVCHDHSSGKHYGIFACDGCAGFFKRSIRRNRQYACKARAQGGCPVDKTHRNQCRSCRLKKCLEAGMNKDAVQHERGPRNSTIRRQVALYLKEASASASASVSTSVSSNDPSALQTTNSAAHHHHHQHQHQHQHHRHHHNHHVQQIATATNSRSTATGSAATSRNHVAIQSSSESREVALATAVTSTSPSATMQTTTSSFMAVRPICQPIPKYPHQIVPNFFGSLDTICESAARLLFLNVKWAKNVPAFTGLPSRDQLILLEEGWRELFVLSAAQFYMPMDGGPLLAAAGLTVDRSTAAEKVASTMAEIRNFQAVIANFQQMRVDPTEYACLKAVVLFKTVVPSGGSDLRILRDVHTISTLQDQAQLTLSKYVQSAYPGQPFRFGKLLLMLPTIKSITPSTIEDLFFKKTIGRIPIERLICDLYKSEDF